MPKDETPRQPQALQAGGRVQSPTQGQDDPSHGAYPEQVFAGESGDPIWEPLGARRPESDQADPQRSPQGSPDERVPAGKIIDLVQTRPSQRPRVDAR